MKRIINRCPNRIKEFRTERGMTQMQLAVAASVHPTQVSQFEMGTPSSLLSASKIAKALGKTVEEVFPGVEFMR